VEENQAVGQRLSDRGASLRAAGLAAQPQPGQPGQADPTATRLAGGGLASAFGALALSGNQLRREAADRTRTAATTQEFATQRQQADLDLRNKLTEISAEAAAEGSTKFNESLTGLATDFNAALNSEDPEQVRNFKTAINEAAINDPNSPQAALASSNLARTILEKSGSSLLGALFNIIPDFLGGEGRGPIDSVTAFFNGGFNNADIASAFDKLTLNQQSGEIRAPNPSGRGDQFVLNLSDLDEADQRLVISLLTRETGQRGDPDRDNPNVPSLRAGF
jgi:hypothetical protein